MLQAYSILVVIKKSREMEYRHARVREYCRRKENWGIFTNLLVGVEVPYDLLPYAKIGPTHVPFLMKKFYHVSDVSSLRHFTHHTLLRLQKSRLSPITRRGRGGAR